MYVTAGDDCSVRTWSIGTRRPVAVKRDEDDMVQSAAFSPDGTHIAIGLSSGGLKVLTADDLGEYCQYKHRKEAIGELKYSPDGHYLAVGSNDHFIDLHDVWKGYRKIGTCKGHSSFITHLDWSSDGTALQSNDGAFELLFWSMPDCLQISRSSQLRDIEWHTWTCTLGWPVQGVYPPYSDGTDVNTCDRARSQTVIASGDDFGKVKLYRYPCLSKEAQCSSFGGHSSHITNVRFSADDRYVLSTGGADLSIFQWRHKGPDVYELGGDNVDSEDEIVPEDNGELDVDVDMLVNYTKSGGLKYEPTDEDDIRVEDDGGEEFMAVKPWLGAIHAPTGWKDPKDVNKPPQYTLELEFVHGYRGFDSRDNVYYTASGEVLYSAAGVGIVYNRRAHVQRFFMEHTDDIICVAIHPEGNIAATGEIGKAALICVWDTTTMQCISKLQGHHQRGVVAVAFSREGDKLFSVGMDDDHSVACWDWSKSTLISEARGDKNKILAISVSPYEDQAVTVGLKHIRFWTWNNNMLKAQKGIFGKKGMLQSILSIEFTGPGLTLTGTADGHIYVWKGNQLSKVIKAHDGPVFDLFADAAGVASAGKDGKVVLWDTSVQPKQTIDLAKVTEGLDGLSSGSTVCIRALNWLNGRLLLGTATNEIYEIMEKDLSARLLVAGHSRGELWGLAAHHEKGLYVTAGDDCSVRTWSIASRRTHGINRDLGDKARSAAFSPDGNHIAIGLCSGNVKIVATDDLNTQVASFKHRKEAIGELKYSPDGCYLAVGSSDNFIDLYDVHKEYKKIGTCKGLSSFISHIDWSLDGKVLQSNDGAYEYLFWSMPDCKQISSSSSLRDTQWHTWTCTFGWPVQGIYPQYSDGSDINACDRAHLGKVLVSSDDFGKVNLFRYPVLATEAECHKYGGHSSHVTNVRFSADDRYVLSTGGADLSIFQWRHRGEGILEEPMAESIVVVEEKCVKNSRAALRGIPGTEPAKQAQAAEQKVEASKGSIASTKQGVDKLKTTMDQSKKERENKTATGKAGPSTAKRKPDGAAAKKKIQYS
jgi:microtubule-associated protein-like 6